MQPKSALVLMSLLLVWLSQIEAALPVLWLDASSRWVLAKEGWRLFSAHFIHLNLYHALLNVAGLWLCYSLTPELFNQHLPFRTLLLALGVSLCLWVFSTDMLPYAGFSGVLYGLFMLGLVPRIKKRNWHAAIAVCVISVWMLWQYFYGPSVTEEQLIGGRIATAAHLYGCAVALLILGFYWTKKKLWCILRG